MTDERSPLASVDPQSLDHLFSLDPLELTDQQLQMVVEKLQADRLRMLSAPQRGEAKPRANIQKQELPKGLSVEELMKKINL